MRKKLLPYRDFLWTVWIPPEPGIASVPDFSMDYLRKKTYIPAVCTEMPAEPWLSVR